MVEIIDFDAMDEWAPSLAGALSEHVPNDVQALIMAREPEFVEDARDILFDLGDRDAIIDATLNWIRSSTVAGYHGSRLTEEEIASVREVGLLPLEAKARRVRLVRALSQHPRWDSVADQLEPELDAHGQGQRGGGREGQVHLTLSRSGLTNCFNHYLTHGSEFDQRVAHALLGEEGEDLLARDGTPIVLKFGVPGAVALKAAHPFCDITCMRDRGDVPNIVEEFLRAWSYSLAHPDFRSSSLRVDRGLLFRRSVRAEWLIAAESVPSLEVVSVLE